MKRRQAINAALSRASDKKRITDSIARIARKLGRAPSRSEFIASSGISAHFVLRSFRGWNEAVRAAGLRPNTSNVRVEDRALLEDWGKQVRRNRGIHPRYAHLREGQYDPSTIERRFGPWSKLPEAFRKFAKGKQGWADVLGFLPVPKPKRTSETKQNSASSTSQNKVQHAPLGDRPMYGNPTNFHALRHEPVNEQGVVLLFGMVAEELGFLVEAVQKGFPDCEAKRQIGPERWQRVSIEFEFESRNFRDHRHPLHGCDVIVCWRHNWDDCPKHIEVVEHSSVVESLANSER
jgi:HNH endonuclease